MTRVLAATLCFGALVVSAKGALSQDADFFAGRNVTVMIGYAVGGTYDSTARLLSRHMGRHIAGNPNFLPQNLPGSGGIKAILHLYSVAPRDGTALGILARSYAVEPAFNPQVAKYAPARFNPIGCTSKEVSVGVLAPPDVPKERISILRRAFDATMKDPAFLADAKKIQIEVDPVSGETMQQVVARIAMFDRSVIDRAIELTEVK